MVGHVTVTQACFPLVFTVSQQITRSGSRQAPKTEVVVVFFLMNLAERKSDVIQKPGLTFGFSEGW